VATLTAGGKRQAGEVRGGRTDLTDLTDNSRRLTFGLGAASSVKRLEIRWLGGDLQVVKDVAVDRVLQVGESGTPR